MAPMSSSTGLATPVPMELQQGERQGRARKRTVGQILADEASALPQPAAAKRQRKAAGAYKYLDGAEGAQNTQTPARPCTTWMCSPVCTAMACSTECKRLSCLPLGIAAAILALAWSVTMLQFNDITAEKIRLTCWCNAADMDLDGGQKKGAPRAQAGRPRRRHKAARRRAAATPKAVTIHQEDSEASSAARGLVMLSGSSSSSSPGSSCSNAAQVCCFLFKLFCSWPLSQ